MTAQRDERRRTRPAAEYGVATGRDTVRFERVLPGPIERVWAYLTESDKRAKWLAGGPMELRVGGRVDLTFRHHELSRHAGPTPEKYRPNGQDPTLGGKVTRCDPPRVLSFTWDESEVTFELSPRGKDVLLVLTHRRLATREDMADVSGGWHIHLDILVDRLNGQEPPAFWSKLAELDEEYKSRLAAD